MGPYQVLLLQIRMDLRVMALWGGTLHFPNSRTGTSLSDAIHCHTKDKYLIDKSY